MTREEYKALRTQVYKVSSEFYKHDLRHFAIDEACTVIDDAGKDLGYLDDCNNYTDEAKKCDTN